MFDLYEFGRDQVTLDVSLLIITFIIGYVGIGVKHVKVFDDVLVAIGRRNMQSSLPLGLSNNSKIISVKF